MHTRRTFVAALFATAGLSSVALGAANADSSSVPPPTVPVPPTCTCPPQPTTAQSPSSSEPLSAPTTAAIAAPVTTAPGVTDLTGAVPVTPTTSPVGQAPVAGSALPANASLEQLQQAVEPMFGPTTDVMAEFAIFGITPPAGVPTPTGAEVDSFDFTLDSLADVEAAYYRATAVITSTQPAADLVTLYQTALPAAGFTQTGDSVESTDSGRQIRWLEFDMPNTTHFMAEFAVGIIDDDVDFVQIEWSDGAVAALGAPFTSWTGLPLVDQTAIIEDASIGNHLAFETQVHLTTGYRVPVEYAQLESQFLTALAGTPYTVDAEASQPGSWATLAGAPFEDLTVHFTEGYVAGTSELNVDSYYDRQG